MAKAPVNSEGTIHLHISGNQPSAEAAELKQHVENMVGKNTDHEGSPVFNPAVSRKQERAMYAAASGHSTLGIPQKVGKEFIKAGKK